MLARCRVPWLSGQASLAGPLAGVEVEGAAPCQAQVSSPGEEFGNPAAGASPPDPRTGVERLKPRRLGRAGRLGECTGLINAPCRQHVLPKPPEPGHRGQGLRPGDGVQTQPLPTQPLQRPAGGENPASLLAFPSRTPAAPAALPPPARTPRGGDAAGRIQTRGC